MTIRDAWSRFGAIEKWMVPIVVAAVDYVAGAPTITAQGGSGIASLTDTGTGDIRVVFAEVAPDANYVVQLTPGGGGDSKAISEAKTTAGFDIQLKTDDGTSGIGVATDLSVDILVFLTN